MIINIRKKNVYGNELIYPACAKAEAFAKLINKKTFSETDLKNIAALGFEPVQVI